MSVFVVLILTSLFLGGHNLDSPVATTTQQPFAQYLLRNAFKSQAVPLPNVGYLGKGYDIIRGNPRPTDLPVDPGYGNAIYDMSSYDNNQFSADFRYIVPDNAEFVECTSCQWGTVSSIITGDDSYRRSLFQQIQVETEVKVLHLFKLSFEASYSSQAVAMETSNSQHVIVDTVAACVAYCGNLQLYRGPPRFTQNFRDAVHLLSDNETEVALFVKMFGTHVVTSVKMGSLFWHRATFDSMEWKKFANFKNMQMIEATAKTAFLSGIFRGSVSITGSTVSDETFSREFKAKSESQSIYSVGPIPPVNGSWYDATVAHPMPVKISLIPITAILNSINFPEEPNIKQKQSILADFLEHRYCQTLKEDGKMLDCSQLDSDPGLPRLGNFGGIYSKDSYFYDMVNNFTGDYNCPNDEFEAVRIHNAPDRKGGLVLCLKNVSDVEGSFGGVYGSLRCNDKNYCNTNGAEALPNPMTDDYKCDRNYQTVDIMTTQIAGCCNSQTAQLSLFACFRHLRKSSLGGFYSTMGNGKVRTINPVTKVASCPAGYKPLLIGKGWNGGQQNDDTLAYVCN